MHGATIDDDGACKNMIMETVFASLRMLAGPRSPSSLRQPVQRGAISGTHIHPRLHSGANPQSSVLCLTQPLQVPLRSVRDHVGDCQLPSSLRRCHRQLRQGRVPWQEPPPSLMNDTRAYANETAATHRIRYGARTKVVSTG
eukprot:COSAG02_NODE_763_length_17431_cov_18.031502_2_plen_142_part_00